MKYIYNQWISSHLCWKCAKNNGQCREKNKKLCKVKKGWRKWSHAILWQDWILSSFMMLCLIFHTAFIINRKNWRITIKFHFKNLSIFLKSERKHKLGPPLHVFVFVLFSMTPTLSPSFRQCTYFLNDP